MRLFLAWSGGRSYELARALAWCIREVLPKESVNYFLSSDIEPGTPWFDALDRGLKESDAVLLCITRDNVRSPWMHFEVGSRLGADEHSRVFTYLLDAKPDELTDPLRKYQAVDSTKGGTLFLLEALRVTPRGSLDVEFERCWPELERKIVHLKFFGIEELVPGFERLFQRKTFHEAMDECADQNWLDRYYAARQTLDRLDAVRDAVDRRWQPYQAALVQELISTVDGYVREMRRFLISEVQFQRGPDGKLDLNSSVEGFRHKAALLDLRWSDKRCERIRELVAQLLDPYGAPVLSESLFFMSLGPFWRKKDFVHRREAEIESGDFTLKEHEIRPCAQSYWDFDRIVFYLTQEYAKQTAVGPDRLIKQVHREREKLEAREDETSAMPLHYALRALLSSLGRDTSTEPIRNDGRSCAQEVLTLIKKKNLDAGGQMQRKIERLLAVTSVTTDSAIT
jgi:hypothetical protein